MSDQLFLKAFPYQEDILALPVNNTETAANWYSKAFGMSLIERTDGSAASVILEREGVRLGFCVNGKDASQDGAAILVSDIHKAKSQLEDQGVATGELRIDERDGQQFEVFFVVAPDELCFYFHQLLVS